MEKAVMIKELEVGKSMKILKGDRFTYRQTSSHQRARLEGIAGVTVVCDARVVHETRSSLVLELRSECEDEGGGHMS
jgi:hypothetical protein